MRERALPITAGTFASLALAVSASADFTNFDVVDEGLYNTADADFGGPDVGMVNVWSIYAVFDNEFDSITAIFVLEDDPNFPDATSMTHTSLAADGKSPGGGFWNWNAGDDTSLSTGFPFDDDPDAALADTYLTIGLRSGSYVDGGDAASFVPGSAAVLADSGILDGTGSITEDFVYIALPDHEQSFPDKDGRVLVLSIATFQGEHASGSWNLQWVNTEAGGGGDVAGAEWTTIPAPGALALLGLAGLAGGRRRRRG